MYKKITLVNGEVYYMPVERFELKRNLLSRSSSSLFFADEQLYININKQNLIPTTALIGIEHICSITDASHQLTEI